MLSGFIITTAQGVLILQMEGNCKYTE